MIAAIVLAAGGASRLGHAKQLVRLDGTSLVRHAATSVFEAGCDPVRIVVGARAEQVRGELRGLDVDIVLNEAWTDGLAGSIRTGVEALVSRERTQAVVLAVCDQPALSSSVIRRLIGAWDGSPEGRVACRYAGTLGVPALFGWKHFPRLMALEGDRGAKALVLDAEGTKIVDWPQGARDIDEPADLD